MQPEERLARLESDVAHIRSDVSETKHEIRDLRRELTEQGKSLTEQGKSLTAAIAEQGKELDGKISALAMALEKFKGSTRVAFTILIVLQLLATGGVAGAVARAFNLL